MRENRLSPSAALLLSLCLAVPATARQPQQQPTAPPTGPVTPVVPPAPATPGVAPPSGAPNTPPAAPATPPPPPGPPGAGPDRLDFQLKFTSPPGGGPAKGGGSAAGSAANLEYRREDYAVLSGNVQLKYQDLDLKADEAQIDLRTKDVIALGNVILDQGPRRLSGDSLTFNLESKTGVIRHAAGQVAPDYYFTGNEVEKTGADTYVIRDGVFTSCTQPVPDWSFRVREAQVEADAYAHVRGASMRVKKLPVFYTPYLLWPVKTERSSGFLVPNIGYSNRRGAELGFAYFQTLGRSYDTTFHVDTYAKGYLGLGNEFRYAPVQGTKGDFVGYYVRDPETDEWRWKVELNQTSDNLPWGMRGVIQYQDFSDFNFFRDFERSFDRNTQRFITSRAFVTGNWGPHLVNFLLDSREVFLNQQEDTLTQRKLPELKYTLRSTRILNSPFYLQLDSSVDYLSINRPGSGQPGTYTGSYGRFDLFPQITLPVRTFPWLNLSLTGGERLTWYQDSLNANQSAFTGDSLTRNFPFASAQVVGPSFSRIFNWNVGSLGKFKHIIEPRFTYTYQGSLPELLDPQIPLFDEVDSQSSTNSGRVALDNRLLGKPNTENGIAREIVLFEIARNYSLDKGQPLQTSGNGAKVTTAGPIETLLRFNPTQKIGLTAAASYDTLFGGISGTSFTGNYGFGANNNLAATWFTRRRVETNKVQADQVRFSGAYGIDPWHLRFEGQVSYDFQLKYLQNAQLATSYTSQCYALRLELRQYRTLSSGNNVNDREVRLMLSLKNVGTFLDLNSRSETVVP
jgi:LPS-assembly protein